MPPTGRSSSRRTALSPLLPRRPKQTTTRHYEASHVAPPTGGPAEGPSVVLRFFPALSPLCFPRRRSATATLRPWRHGCSSVSSTRTPHGATARSRSPSSSTSTDVMASTFSASPITRFPTVRPNQARRSAWNAERTPITSKQSRREARRARDQYGLLVIPGLELTYDDPDPDEAAHALALGLRSFDPLEAGLKEAIGESRGLGAAIVAAHPHGRDPDPKTTPNDTLVLAQPGSPRRSGRPVRALQPGSDLRLDRVGRPAGRRGRRLPPSGAPDDLEDALALPETGRRCHRLSALERQGVRRSRGDSERSCAAAKPHRSFTSLIPAVHHASTQRRKAESQDQKRCRTC